MLVFVLQFLATAARQIVALLFLFASVGKLSKPSIVRRSVEAYGLPRFVANPLGFILPWVELVLATSLLTGFFATYTVMIAVTLLLVFVIAQTVVLSRGYAIPCGCFGVLSAQKNADWTNVTTNLLLSAACIVVLIAHLMSQSMQLSLY